MKKIKHTSEHMPNNWLKNHGYPMRRKPYGKHKLKKEYIIFDEFNNIPGGYKIDELIKVQRVLCDDEKNKIKERNKKYDNQ
ncbi:hypothetical protein [Clostridium sp.]|jgi:hypothetical protein|uniref:hypothetical protein n=1 Tax=Clostridium sp. TaxID=1506 RepID=UPI002900E7A2|nr:hypothetical protein [Clostridium sp.]MDU2156340.1 hypothetical protein [Clostridium sp.]